ncbi:TPA: tol-pal system-associated acyl-CoA thioesterase [Pseudomonas aeruginosa]|nr:MAG: tol-pal system-associated acyl-CoA thioesterase [Pseudoxanthomonas spadix]HCH0556917.1 tol-pal system-associated acyl-CoA thioesterase [Pseudomonas aeruginosa]
MTVDPAAQAVADGQPFSIPTRVYWEDTDAGGVVYHAQYVAFLERARSEWMRARGQMQEQLRREHDLVFVVRGMQLDFLRPARLDDLLTVTVQVRQARRASIVFDQAIWRGEEKLLAAQVKIAAVSASAFRPVGLDEALYQEFKLLEVPA